MKKSKRCKKVEELGEVKSGETIPLPKDVKRGTCVSFTWKIKDAFGKRNIKMTLKKGKKKDPGWDPVYADVEIEK